MIPAWLTHLSVQANALTGGPEGYTLCARFYEDRLNGSRTARVLVVVADTLFWFDKDHCRKAWLTRALFI